MSDDKPVISRVYFVTGNYSFAFAGDAKTIKEQKREKKMQSSSFCKFFRKKLYLTFTLCKYTYIIACIKLIRVLSFSIVPYKVCDKFDFY